jgi:hypothetical protein
MPKYVSKRYLREKWDALKWDMEHVVFEGEGDNVVEEVVRIRFELLDLMDSIRKEIEC